MSDTGAIAKYQQQWQDMDPKFKYAMGAIVVGGVILLAVKSKEHDRFVQGEQERKTARATATAYADNRGLLPNSGNSFSALPSSTRNQGIEDLLASLQRASADAKEAREANKGLAERLGRIDQRMGQLETRGGATAYGAAALSAPSGDAGGAGTGAGPAYENLPPPVDFAQPGAGAKDGGGDKSPFSEASIPAEAGSTKPSRTSMRIWDAEAPQASAKRAADAVAAPLTIPVNAALESVMLTGINARSNSAGGAASGTILSANNVGAPFVSRLKGSAILPNGWRVSDFNDCFISGTGIAILSSERANVIANVMSCIDKRGNVFEAKIKAYGVDLDGIQGIAGRVVTKQGAVLAKTALAGVASGLGTAFAPSALPGYNQNMQSGERQGIQYPNPSLIAGSALGGGVNEAGRALSKFYLDYAKEMFPVIEVNAGTRITWILQESVELNQMKRAN